MELSERTGSIIYSHDWLTRGRPPADPLGPPSVAAIAPTSGNRHPAGLMGGHLWRPGLDLRRSSMTFWLAGRADEFAERHDDSATTGSTRHDGPDSRGFHNYGQLNYLSKPHDRRPNDPGVSTGHYCAGWLLVGVAVKVALFVTCLNDTMFPQTGQATVRLLRRLGVDVEFPTAQTCCGQMHVNSGYVPEAIPVVRAFVDAFAGYDAVVAPSGSCVASAREQHKLVAARSGDRALINAVDDVSPHVYELSEFLVDVLGVVDVGAYFPHRVTLHPTCHSTRLLGVGDRPEQLLQAVRGITMVDLPAAQECCGFGGTFSLKNPDVSVAMGSDKARHVRESGAEVLVAGDNSCLMHIGGLLSRERAGIRVMHLAEILASTEEAA